MTVRKDKKNNKWYVSKRYKDWNGENKRLFKRGFQTKKEAQDYIVSFLDKVNGNQSMFFDDYIDLYYQDIENRVRLNTLLTKKAEIEQNIRPYFKEMRLCDITSTDVMKWQNELLKKKTKFGNKYSGETLRTIHSQLSALFNHACRYYGLQNNPARIAGTLNVSKPNEKQFWTLEEYNKFLDAVSDKTMSHICFEVLFWCGLRIGELLALTPGDFDFSKKVVRINKSLQRIKGKDVVTPPKTNKSNRNVYLPDFLVEELKNYLENLYKVEDDEQMFPVTKSYLHHELKRGASIAGVKVISAHELRHSHATMLLENGYSATDVAERLGHESEQITFIYAHVYDGKEKDMARTLDKMKEGE